MVWPFSERARKQWDEWNIRVVVLISLSLQVGLIIFANSRRKRASKVLTATVWSFYLLADWIAAFAVGLISSAQTDDCPETTAVNRQLAAFWAPFLLLHLGGPDTITAFSLEDNELWIRHFLGLLVQIAVVLYSFFQSLQNKYWIPTVLLFFAGGCKYAERTVSLYRACLENFKKSLLSKPDPGPNYARLMAELSAWKASGVPIEIKVENEPKNGSDGIPAAGATIGVENEPNTGSVGVTIPEENEPEKRSDVEYSRIIKGYEFFDTFKGLIVDHMFSFHERDESRRFFLSRKPLEAFQVLEVELNFMYDVLYTKMAVVHTKFGYLCRLLCIALIAVCFQQFASHHHHHNVSHFDIIVSYTLLVGAVVLEMVALFNLVFSDWVIVSAREEVSRFLVRLPFCIRKQRWSNVMFRHSFIRFCLMEQLRGRWLNKIAEFIRLEDFLIETQYSKEETCHESLKKIVFTELEAKAKKATTTETTKEMFSARGVHVLNDNYSSHYFHPSIWASLSDEAEYDESLLLWHIATELCYFTDNDSEEDGRDGEEDREVCKLLSDYMLYLLVMRPTLMSAVAGIAQVRFQDTCEEAKWYFKELQMGGDNQCRQACKKLLEVDTTTNPKEVKGDRSKSLLFDACVLAKDLKKVRGDQWKIMSRIWVELLSYAAGRCRPGDHARQLAQGGEFINFVWLLMVHFGLGEQFKIQAGHAKVKFLVKK